MIIAFIIISCIVAYLIFKQTFLYRQKLKAEMLLLTIEKSNDFYYYVKIKPRIEYIYFSKSFENLFGPGSLKEHILHPYDAYVKMSHPDDMEICDAKITGTADYSQPFNVRLRTANGEYTWFEEFATPIYENGEFVALHGLYRENNATMLLKQQVEQAQSEDLLTGTKNRLYFEDQLAIYDSKLDTSIGLIICNIDFIKQTNVKNGFESGNKLIVQLATLLLHASKEKAFVCRTNGDEFTIIYPNSSENEFIQLMNEIRQQIAVYNRTNKALKLNVSIGGYYSLSSVGQIPTLLMHAERKMQAEKEHHKLFAQTIKNA